MLPENGRKLLQPRAFAHVHHQGRATVGSRIAHQFGELRNQVDGKIVDRVIAQVLQSAQHRAFARAAHSRDDDQFRSGWRWSWQPRPWGGAGLLSRASAQRLGFGPRLPSRHFSSHANRLRFQLSDRRMDGGEKIRIRRLPDQLMVVIWHRHFHVVRMLLVRENDTRFRLASARYPVTSQPSRTATPASRVCAGARSM